MNDETTDACQALGPTRPADLAQRSDRAELLYLWERSTDDERAVVMTLARQMHGKGRKEYGPLRLAGDGRNWVLEALAEIVDALFYVAVAMVVIGRWWVANKVGSNGKAG